MLQLLLLLHTTTAVCPYITCSLDWMCRMCMHNVHAIWMNWFLVLLLMLPAERLPIWIRIHTAYGMHKLNKISYSTNSSTHTSVREFYRSIYIQFNSFVHSSNMHSVVGYVHTHTHARGVNVCCLRQGQTGEIVYLRFIIRIDIYIYFLICIASFSLLFGKVDLR